jgi:hypothetical protein
MPVLNDVVAISVGAQLLALFVLAIPVACVSWTLTHEEVFREPREWFAARSKSARSLLARKFFYLFTCEYCFSHYVSIAALFLTRYTLLLPGWRGYVIAGFSLVWIANVYMSLFGRLRLEITHERHEIAAVQTALGTKPPEVISDLNSTSAPQPANRR